MGVWLVTDIVGTGDPFRPSASAWNDLLRLRNRFPQMFQNIGETHRSSDDAQRIDIKNNTGQDRDAGSILKLDAPLFEPADAGIENFRETVAFVGKASTEADDPIAILAEPVKNGKIATAWVAPVAAVQVDVTDAAHGFAKPGATLLVSDASSGFRILWKEAGTGDKWAYVQLIKPPAAAMQIWMCQSDDDINPNDIDVTAKIYTGDAGAAPADSGDTLEDCQYIWFSDGNVISADKKFLVIDMGDGVNRILPQECE